MKNVYIFDLDETVIDSAHRTPNNPDGTLNLPAYIANHTPANVAKDRLLPLSTTMQKLIKQGEIVIILTARDMAFCDYVFLVKHGIATAHIFSRDRCNDDNHYKMSDGQYKVEWFRKMPMHLTTGKHVIMFDDSKPVKKAMRAIGVTTLCAHKINKKLYVQARGK